MQFFPYFLLILACIESSCSQNDEGKEFSYRLDQYKIFGSQVSDLEGSYLKVGENWETPIGSATDQAECSRLDVNKYYKDAFQTKFYRYTPSRPDDVFSTYFVFTNKEVWDCTIKPGGVTFYRVVNELYGIKLVKEIYYFDGTTVRLAPTPVQSRELDENQWTVGVKEVKYLKKSDPFSPIKYEGKVKLNDAPVPSFFELVGTAKVDEDRAKRIPQKTMPDVFETALIGSEGKTVRVGTEKRTFIGNVNIKATCEEIVDEDDQESKNLYLEKFIPRCSLVISKNGAQSLLTTETNSRGIDKTVKLDYFSVTYQEVWKCTYKEDGKGKTLIRRVTDMVAAIPIKEIQYYSGITVWKYKLNENSNSVKIREVYYYETNFNDRMEFLGDVELKNPAVEEGETILSSDILVYNRTHPGVRPVTKVQGLM